MADDRIIVAIERIERALSRLERIAAAPVPAPPPVAAHPDHQALAQRHQRLRSQAESTLSMLDMLIDGIDEGKPTHG